MRNNIKFYQNNPCVIIRDINDDFAEVQLSHHFAANMELSGQCQGCCIGDSDNKIPCTCEDRSWIIEEVQDEENKVLVIVEKRLLADKPIESVRIEKLEKIINDKKSEIERLHELHSEWSEAVSVKRNLVEALRLEVDALTLKLTALSNSCASELAGIERIKSKYNEMLIEIQDFSLKNRKITRQEYDNLVERDKKLSALELRGVDNWEWYDESLAEL